MKIKKIESTIRPNNFRIGDKEDNLTEVVFFDDIEEVVRNSNDDEEQTIYTYYEYKMKVVSRDDLESYINDNLETWLKLAKEQFVADKSAEIRSIRDKLLNESDKQFLIDRLGFEIPTNITATTLLSVIKNLFDTLGDIVNGDWARYRQQLRDITKQEGFPFNVEFPTAPGKNKDE